ncbi:MAG: glycosyltransferase family 2 protein [Patescibacteria group bacterium]|jgi:glycosyltransferase involved in cell wall biosynthesis
MENIKFSVIIPAYNEQATILTTINALKDYLRLNFANHYEIIVVNDGSNDKTAEILGQINENEIKVINHPYNKGYGASVKTAVAASLMDWILVFDADGQHKIEDIGRLIQASDGFDMVVGSRQGYKGPLVRQPGKKVLHWVAEYLVEHKIPDLNSGLRLIKREYFNKYAHLLPNAFSWTTTITLAFFKNGLNVNYLPIEIKKRQGGKSTVKISDAFKTLMLILRIIMLFSPLRIFLPITIVLGTLTLAFGIFDLSQGNITDATVLLLVSTILIFFFGLLADQIASIRREIK